MTKFNCYKLVLVTLPHLSPKQIFTSDFDTGTSTKIADAGIRFLTCSFSICTQAQLCELACHEHDQTWVQGYMLRFSVVCVFITGAIVEAVCG